MSALARSNSACRPGVTPAYPWSRRGGEIPALWRWRDPCFTVAPGSDAARPAQEILPLGSRTLIARRSAGGAWRRCPSSRSGGWRRCPRRCRRGSIRRRAAGRASADRAGTSRVAAVDRPPPVGAAQEDARQPPRQLGRDLPEVERASSEPVGKRHLQRVAVEVVKLLERLDQEIVHGEPDRPAPVRVAAEETARRLGGLVVDAVIDAVRCEHVRMVPVIARQRAHAVRRQELVLVQHEAENARQLLAADDRQEPPHSPPGFVTISTCSRNSGWLSMNHCIRRLKPGSRSTISGSSVSTAKSGIEPDHRAHLHRVVPRRRHVQHVVVEAVRRRPRGSMPSPPRLRVACAM